MKGAKIRVAVIYILVIIIIGLLGYLIYNFFINNKDVNNKKEVNVSDIAEQCTFNISNGDYGSIINGNNSNICVGLNKLIINDIILDGKQIDLQVNYYNGDTDIDDGVMGVYIDGKRVLSLASSNNKNNIGVFDNKLFVFVENQDKPNVVVYDKDGRKVYDLETALSKANISDPAFVEMAKTNKDLNVTLRNSNINSNSFSFGPTEFTFSTALKGKCTVGTNIGSNYKVTFSGNNFSVPEPVSFNVCNG